MQKRFNRFLILAIVFFGAGSLKANTNANSNTKKLVVACKVEQVYPQGADFFKHIRGPNPPVTGDTITLEVGGNAEITDLTFDSGNGISLKAVGATLFSVNVHKAGLIEYHGRVSGTLNRRYTGSFRLQVSEDGQNAKGQIVVLSELFNFSGDGPLFDTVANQEFNQHRLDMVCEVL